MIGSPISSILTRRRNNLVALLLFGAMASAPQVLRAATLTWDSDAAGGVATDGGGNWQSGTGNNWLNGSTNTPWNNANGDIAAFGDGVTTGGITSAVTVVGGVTTSGITFNALANNASNSLFNIQGGTITLNNGAVIRNNATAGSALHTIGSALYTTGTVTLTGRRFWMANSSFAGGGTLNIETTEQALFTNTGAFDGLSVINLNTGGIDIRNGGLVQNYATGTTLYVNNNLALNTNSISAGTVVDWKGAIVVQGTRTLSLTPVDVDLNQLRISSSISERSGVGNVAVNGSNAAYVVFAADNTYTGTTVVNNSGLQVGVGGVGSTGSGSVTVNSALGLSGSGTVKGAATISNGASLRPGDSIGTGTGYVAGTAVGKLTFSSTLQLASGSTTYLTLNGATGNEANPFDGIQTVSLLDGTTGQHDQISVTGGFTLNGGSTIRVSLDSGYTPGLGDVYNLIDWGSVTLGTFNVNTDLILETNTAMTAAGLSWQRDQFLSSGIIYVVPEPQRALLILLGLIACLTVRRRR